MTLFMKYISLSIASFLFAFSLSAAEAVKGFDVERKRIEQDCRAEGEGEGLKGQDLNEFVENCINDLSSLQFEATNAK